MGIENETNYEERCAEFSKLLARLGDLANDVTQKLGDIAEEFDFDLDTEYELFDIRMRDLLERMDTL